MLHYKHAVLVIAKGLKELGYEFYGNIEFWYDHVMKEYNISKAPEDFKYSHIEWPEMRKDSEHYI
jgi:hypothetical protein